MSPDKCDAGIYTMLSAQCVVQSFNSITKYGMILSTIAYIILFITVAFASAQYFLSQWTLYLTLKDWHE